ncbi:germin-like protein 4-1 [Brachypodium distachyon]|uniref:Germin-like protein n=1 Tax=Brachypodium distachyon TaxID=15368 RepID=I1J1V9_BRADI|nr:germin-like protein 4-1 [Brachypodium distachyon]KQJ84624.1 hypothetical protein BRADI_5g21910v3 [Brachypodium distachyon]|eukprot:XP_003580555.1 germin-like protein 4-1 [Brachypodium distachyon]
MAASRTLAALFAVAVLVLCSRVLATDPTQLQDFCVADMHSPVLVNGFVCKDAMMVSANDFFMPGLNVPAPLNAQGSAVKAVTVLELPGLNTLGISLVRIDYKPGGQNAPHIHPRGTEVLTVIKGQLLVGFVTTNAPLKNKLFQKQLVEGDVFVFPQGLIHFQLNNGAVPAVAFAGLSSQNFGVTTIADAVFGANPPITVDILAKAFMIDAEQVEWIQTKFATPPAAGGGGGGYMPGNMTGGGDGGGYPGMRKKRSP